MKKAILILFLFISSLIAGESVIVSMKYHKLPNVTNSDFVLKNKNKEIYKSWLNDKSFFTILSNVNEEHALKNFSIFHKSICSNKTSEYDNKKTCILISPNVSSKLFVKVYNYQDYKNDFLNNPALFTINDSVGLVVFDLTDKHFKNESELSLTLTQQLSSIKKVIENLSKQSSLNTKDILVVGNFGVSKKILEKYLPKDYVLKVETGTKLYEYKNKIELAQTNFLLHHKDKKIKSINVQYEVGQQKDLDRQENYVYYTKNVGEYYPMKFSFLHNFDKLK